MQVEKLRMTLAPIKLDRLHSPSIRCATGPVPLSLSYLVSHRHPRIRKLAWQNEFTLN
jgi:hypothetical protein